MISHEEIRPDLRGFWRILEFRDFGDRIHVWHEGHRGVMGSWGQGASRYQRFETGNKAVNFSFDLVCLKRLSDIEVDIFSSNWECRSDA